MNDLIIDALAAYRLTRLVTKDTITEDARGLLIRDAYYRSGFVPSEGMANMSYAEWAKVPQQDDDAPKLATFMTCQWCVSTWVGLGVVAARTFVPGVWGPVARALAFSAVTGAIEAKLP